MKDFILRATWIVGLVIGCLQANAQDAYVLTNSINSTQNATFTNSLGTASVTNGMIVFEGQLDADITVTTNYNATSGHMLASLQLLVQVKLFDELPASNEVGTAQGAVAAMRDGTGLTTGKYYVWGSINNVMEWVPLYKQTGGQQFAVTEGATNYITFVFNYSASPVSYQVFIGDTSATQAASTPVTTLTADVNSKINGVSLLGTGALQTYASASGDIGPLSSSIGFSVYATADGVRLILDTQDEKSTGWLVVKAYINGEWVEVGKVQANGTGHYEFLATYPLVVGQAYAFEVIDEIGNVHELGLPVAVKTIKMESVVMNASVLSVTFNTESGKNYQVLLAETLNATSWTPATVYFPVDTSVDASGWSYGSEGFTATDTSTTIRIPRGENGNPANKAFFKIKKLN